MRAVDLNFSLTPFRNNTPFYLGYGLGAALIVAFTVYNSMAFFKYSQDSAVLEHDYAANRAKLDTLRREATDLQTKIEKVDIGTLNGRATFTNGLLERRRFSWTDLLNSMEEAQVYQVRLLSLSPRIQEKGILIDARAVAHDLKSMWNFQQNLINHPKFRRVYPGGWTKSTEEGEIVFNIAFNYFPQGAPEGAVGLTPQEAGLDFTEAPGIDGAVGDEGQSEGDEPVPEEPLPGQKPPATAGKPGGGSPTLGAGGAASAPSNPRSLADAGRDRTRVMDTVAADPAAPVAGGGAAQPPGVRGAFGMPAGSTGASGTAGNKPPPRRVGRGLPPGSHGVRPPPPEKPDVPMLPLPGKDTGDTGDDR